jgi:hypothetical protein
MPMARNTWQVFIGPIFIYLPPVIYRRQTAANKKGAKPAPKAYMTKQEKMQVFCAALQGLLASPQGHDADTRVRLAIKAVDSAEYHLTRLPPENQFDSRE